MRILLTVIAVCLLTVGSFAQSVRKVEILGSPLGNSSSGEVAVVNSTGLVYTNGQLLGTNVGVINPTTNTVVKVIRPLDLNSQTAIFLGRANQTTNIVYFLRGAGAVGSTIEPVDGRPSSPTFNEFLPTLTYANQAVATFVIDQTSNRMYVATRTNNATPAQSQVHIVDINPASPTFHQILSTVALPSGLTIGNIAVNTTTGKVYMATITTGGVYVFNSQTLTASLIPNSQPGGVIAINEVSNTIYAGRSNTPLIQAIDGITDTLTTNINIANLFTGTLGEQVAVNFATERVYALLNNTSLAVIDAKRSSPTFNTVLATIPNVGQPTGAVAVDEGLNKIVVNSGTGFGTSIIDGATNQIVATVRGNLASVDVAINPVTHRAFVGYTGYTTQNVNLNDNSAVSIATGYEIGDGVVNPNNNSFYFGVSSAAAGIGILNQNDTLGWVGDLIHNFGRYVFAAQNKTTNRLYFPNSSANISGTLTSQTNGFIEAVNGATNMVGSDIEVGGQPFSNPAVNEATNKIYQMNAGSGTGFPSKISVINGATNSASDVNTTAFPANTSFIREPAVNPTTNKIYFRVGEGTSIGVINGATDVATPLAGFTNITDIKVNPTLNRVYLLTATGIRVLNGADDTEIASIALTSPGNLTINQTTGKIYVRNFASQILSVIDPNTNAVITSAALPAANTFYSTMAINEATNEIYIGAQTDFNQENTSSVLFINGDTLAVRKTLPVPLRPSRIQVNPATQTAYVTSVNASQRAGVVVISTRSASTPFDFDGDGKADLSVFRPSSGIWYLQQSTAGFTGAQFGANGDLITPADYDGDGKTDLAVFRAGVWYLQRSSLGFTGIQFGLNGDIPMPADFDADGKADLGVFRPSTGTWYLQQSTNGFTGVQFGSNGDVPTAADYDGDGKADIAVFRPAGGIWYLNRSQLGFTGIQFGTGGDKPVPADYDADGKTDLAVFRPAGAVWYLQRSQAGFTGVQFGLSSDLPVAADYDGDGKTDVAVFRPSDGAWYLQRSTLGFTGIQFGLSGDKPAPNAFVP